MTIKLTEPIQAHGEERSEITLRPPKAADVNACGYPLRLLSGGVTTFDAPAISALIARLGNIPPGSVDHLGMRDWNACMQEILNFFVDVEARSSSDASTLPTTGNGILAPH